MNGLDTVKCTALLESLPEQELALRFVFHNTKYVTKELVRVYAELLLRQWIASRDPSKRLALIFEANKVGSRHWLYFLFHHLLPEHKRITEYATQEELDTIDEILFLDDFSITGQNLIGTFDQLAFGKKTKHISVQIILAFSYNNFLGEMNGFVGRSYGGVKYLVAESLTEPKSTLLTPAFHDAINNKEERDLIPFHAEYKIPDRFCTYAALYEQCRAPPDRSFMREVETFWSTLQ